MHPYSERHRLSELISYYCQVADDCRIRPSLAVVCVLRHWPACPSLAPRIFVAACHGRRRLLTFAGAQEGSVARPLGTSPLLLVRDRASVMIAFTLATVITRAPTVTCRRHLYRPVSALSLHIPILRVPRHRPTRRPRVRFQPHARQRRRERFLGGGRSSSRGHAWRRRRRRRGHGRSSCEGVGGTGGRGGRVSRGGAGGGIRCEGVGERRRCQGWSH